MRDASAAWDEARRCFAACGVPRILDAYGPSGGALRVERALTGNAVKDFSAEKLGYS